MNKLLLLTVAISFLFIFSTFAYAEQTVKTIEVPLGYFGLTLQDEIKTVNFTIYPPDGISKIESLEFIVKADVLTSSKVKGGIIFENTTYFCIPNEWSTPTWNVANYEMSFDCTSLIPENFNWDFLNDYPLQFSFKNNNFAGNVKPYIKMTYYNKPKYRMSIKGTEYNAGDDGIVFIQLLDEDYQPINNSQSTCYISIYYPNSYIWKYGQLMSYADEGLFYYSFDVPYVAGVYMVSAYCTIPAEVGFVSNKVQENFESGGTSGGVNWSTSWTLDGATIESVYPYEGTYYLYGNEDEYPQRSFIGTSDYTNIDYSFYWRLESIESEEIFYVWLIDADGTPFLLLSKTDGDDDNVYHQKTGTLYTSTDGINLSGTLTFKINTSGTWEYNDYYRLDYINISLNAPVSMNETNYEEIRGSGEVHVTSPNGPYIYEYSGSWMNLTASEFYSGYYYNNITVTSLTSDTQDVDIKFHGKEYLFCDDIIELKWWNSTLGNWQEITAYSCSRNPALNTIEIKHTHSLSLGATEKFQIVYKNRWWKMMHEQYHVLNGSYGFMYLICEYYKMSTNTTTESIPLNESHTEISNTILKWCSHVYDSYYFVNKLYQESVSMNMTKGNDSATENTEIFLSNLIKINQQLYDEYDQYVDRIINYYTLGALYNTEIVDAFIGYNVHGPLGNTSITFLIRQELDELREDRSYFNSSRIANSVWEYPERNLTYYPSASVDYQQISEFVWNFSDRTVNLSESVETLLSVNSSIFSKLHLIQEDISNLNNLSAEEVWLFSNKTVNLTEITDFLIFMNDTLTVYYNETITGIIEIISEIDLTNSTIINEIVSSNNSIFSKLYLIQDDLSEINTTTWDTNYWIKDNNDILINLSLGNVTVFADINWSKLREEVWNKTSYEKINHDVLSFADDEVQLVVTTQFCEDNTTLVYNHNVTRSILGYEIKDNFEEREICTYGCYNNECRQPPHIIYGTVFILILVISGLIFYFSPKDEMT